MSEYSGLRISLIEILTSLMKALSHRILDSYGALTDTYKEIKTESRRSVLYMQFETNECTVLESRTNYIGIEEIRTSYQSNSVSQTFD